MEFVLNDKILTLTINGESASIDLSNVKGDIGVRGPQGPAGVVLTDTGELDLTGYYSKEDAREDVGNIETAIDEIIAMADALINA